MAFMCLDENYLFHPGTWFLNKRYPDKSVMFKGKRKYEVSDPGFYDSLIAKQKKQACRNPNDAMGWVKLGCLCESKLDMTNCFAKRNLAIRYFIPVMVLFFLLTVTYAGHFSPNFFMLSSFPEIVISIFIVISAISLFSLFSLQWKGNQVSESAFWHGILAGKKSIVGIESHFRSRFHCLS
jgi:hypothetical protein